MNKIKIIFGIGMVLITVSIIVSSCTGSKEFIAAKTGAQLWGENCMRCHNSPTPVAYTDHEWDVIGAHMQIRTNLTGQEVEKVVAFLQSAN